MSIEIKQKIKEVADDFANAGEGRHRGRREVLPDKPKSSSQNLSEEQLNVDLRLYHPEIIRSSSLEAGFRRRRSPRRPAAESAPAPQPAQSAQPSPAAPAEAAERSGAEARSAPAQRARAEHAAPRRQKSGNQTQRASASRGLPQPLRQAAVPAAAGAQARAPRDRHQRRHGQRRPL